MNKKVFLWWLLSIPFYGLAVASIEYDWHWLLSPLMFALYWTTGVGVGLSSRR